jgi:hypothetical protein
MRRGTAVVIKAAPALALGLFLGLSSLAHGQAGGRSTLQFLLPAPAGWALAETPSVYLPATLFEYIDGGAENYLSYGFRELVVANYKKEASEAVLTVEIYDMGDAVKAFGVYSSERYPESRFLEIGNEGYSEEGALNFIVGAYYVKLLCFECGTEAEQALTSVGREIEKKVPEKGELPPRLGLFPEEGRIPKTEKFVLQNVLGYAFFHDGYMASYRALGQEFELFIIEGVDATDAENMMTEYLDSQKERGQAGQPLDGGFHVRDRYSGNIYLARSGRMILGVIKIKDGFEDLGVKYLKLLAQAADTRSTGFRPERP